MEGNARQTRVPRFPVPRATQPRGVYIYWPAANYTRQPINHGSLTQCSFIFTDDVVRGVRAVEHGHAFPPSLSLSLFLRKRALAPLSRRPPSLPFLFLPLFGRGGAKRSEGSERQRDSDGGMPPSKRAERRTAPRWSCDCASERETEGESLMYVRAREEGLGGRR